MFFKYEIDIQTEAVQANLNRITNQIYKLLPIREEGLNWKMPLATIIEELGGMNSLMENKQTTLFSLLCKLEGLFLLDSKEDFFTFRRTIFECLNLMGRLIQLCQ
jgi:hypothetical protein